MTAFPSWNRIWHLQRRGRFAGKNGGTDRAILRMGA
jgi:hypothetical protein